MRIRILWVGKTRESWASEAIDKYLKLLRHFAEVEVVEIKEDKARGAGDEVIKKALASEGGRILDKSSSYVLLDELGRQLSSTGLARMIRDTARMEFVLGGPWGVSEDVKAHAADTVAMSKMTLTHEMARMLFLEQLYRAFTINTGRGYHH